MTTAGLLASWLAGAIALPLTLFTAAAGQGVGTLLGGGTWIGISVPWTRQSWALVNQPELNFAALPAATGYWLGSIAVPFLVTVLIMPLSVRFRTLAAQLFAVQWAWTAAVIGVLWQPTLDPEISHSVRWLQFRGMATELWWLTVILAAASTTPVILRLLATARLTDHFMGRGRRLVVVMAHLVPVPAVWAIASTVARDEMPAEALVVSTIPIALALLVAWVGYPAPLSHAIAPLSRGTFVRLISAAVILWMLFWSAGRPLPEGRAAALQWGSASSFNNIRPWMEPIRAPWVDPPR